jgi:hypothetical protein
MAVTEMFPLNFTIFINFYVKIFNIQGAEIGGGAMPWFDTYYFYN